MSVPSPCIGICTLDKHKICQGCFRSVGEIAAWTCMTDRQRQSAVEQANRRSQEANCTIGLTAPAAIVPKG